jgi:hypothetical protein
VQRHILEALVAALLRLETCVRTPQTLRNLNIINEGLHVQTLYRKRSVHVHSFRVFEKQGRHSVLSETRGEARDASRLERVGGAAPQTRSVRAANTGSDKTRVLTGE